MSKIHWKPGTLIYPVPAVLVSCGSTAEEYNLITISWTGTICTNPPMCYISVRPERYSYEIIKKNREFVINLTTKKLAFATDWCGVKSGKEVNKFKELNLTPMKGQVVKAPLLKESPVNIECIVKETLFLGSHHMFIADVAAVNVDEELIDEETNKFLLSNSKPIAYCHGKYYDLGMPLGKFGFSVKKKIKKGISKKT